MQIYLLLFQKLPVAYIRILRQVSGIKYLIQMSTYHLACGDSKITCWMIQQAKHVIFPHTSLKPDLSRGDKQISWGNKGTMNQM